MLEADSSQVATYIPGRGGTRQRLKATSGDVASVVLELNRVGRVEIARIRRSQRGRVGDILIERRGIGRRGHDDP